METLKSWKLDFGEEDFSALRALVKEHTGIHLSEQKRELVYGRLSRRLRALGLESFRTYRELLEKNEGDELVQFCNAITTNLTSFFRETHHFQYLREHLLAPRAADPRGLRRLRFWSAGCSTGEEPYSLAMTIHEALPDVRRWDVKILATDLDTDVLARGARGLYDEERVRNLSPERIERFFRRQGAGFAVRDELRDLISFRELNLMHTLPMKGPLDAIFCRNVVIYFDKDTQRQLFARIAQLQGPGGILFLGHSETLFRVSDDYTLVGKTVYRRN
ncbi:MAG TPA: protein-glutamate O-methyltransferase CheR [Steroidobacteraceae bacterium]|jgi:chemotaxis protein methyltransferase CheR|nr:protein-glutamate O-methyltransferase CheR [Steroidobacteraceae bacterium]